MKITFYSYLKLLWPICLIDFFCVVLFSAILPQLFPYLQVHFAYLSILVCVILVWILSYRGSVQTGRLSTGIFATLIYVFVWRFVLSVLVDALLGADHYAIYASKSVYWIIGVLMLFLIGVPVISFLSWPAAYLGRKKAIEKEKTLPLNPKKSHRPWVGIVVLFYIRTIVILFVLNIFYNMWIHEAFRCSFVAWGLPSCFYKPDYGLFLILCFLLLFFNAVLICVDTVLGRRSFSSKALLVLDFALALPSWLLAGITQAIVCSLPFVARARMWLVNRAIGRDEFTNPDD